MNDLVQAVGWLTLTIGGGFVLFCAAAYVVELGCKLVRKGISYADLREAIIEWKQRYPEKAKRYE